MSPLKKTNKLPIKKLRNFNTKAAFWRFLLFFFEDISHFKKNKFFEDSEIDSSLDYEYKLQCKTLSNILLKLFSSWAAHIIQNFIHL